MYCELYYDHELQDAHTSALPCVTHVLHVASSTCQWCGSWSGSAINFTRIFWCVAPKSLALAEGCMGPLASFFGPLAPFWGLLPLSVPPMIFSDQVYAFDTKHVEFGPKMAEIAQIAWKLREIAWNCVNTRVKFFESITNEFLSSSTCILIPNMLNLAQKWLK